MHLLCRADAGPHLGIGHAVRALALAEAARERGWQVTLAGDVAAPWLRREAERLGVGSVAGFLDADGLGHAVRGLDVDAVAVDHYGLPGDLRDAANAAGAVLLSVEDFTFGRRPADIVVNYHVGAEPDDRPRDGSGVVLLGPAYAPVRAAVRTARLRRETSGGRDTDPPRVLVVMGGTDAAGVTSLVLDVLQRAGCTLAVTVVGGATAAPRGALRVRALPGGQPLPDLMAGNDLLVSAAGVTTYEACCIGLPAALLAVVPNQLPGYERLVERGLVVGLGTPQHLRAAPDAVAAELRVFVRDPAGRRDMALRAAQEVDGWGCARLLDAVADVAG